MPSQAHIAGIVAIDGVPASRNIIVIKNDPSGYAVVGSGVSESDGTFDISYQDWTGAVIALAIDKYGEDFNAVTPLETGMVIHPTVPNGYVYYVTIDGTTGASEPVWATDESVVSGSVTFSPHPYYRPIASGPLIGEVTDIEPSGDPLWSYVKSLMLFNGDNGSIIITDEAARVWSVSGSAMISTTASKFGGSSLYLNGTSAYLSTAYDSAMQAETMHFTIEGWIFPTADVRGYIATNRDAGSSGWLIRREANGSFGFSYIGSGKTSIVSGAGAVPSGVWTYYRVDRDSAGMRLYINNALIAEATTINAASVSSRPISIGSARFDGSAYNYFQGFIDSHRMTFGVSRPTDIILPVSEFPVGPV